MTYRSMTQTGKCVRDRSGGRGPWGGTELGRKYGSATITLQLWTQRELTHGPSEKWWWPESLRGCTQMKRMTSTMPQLEEKHVPFRARGTEIPHFCLPRVRDPETKQMEVNKEKVGGTQ